MAVPSRRRAAFPPAHGDGVTYWHKGKQRLVEVTRSDGLKKYKVHKRDSVAEDGEDNVEPGPCTDSQDLDATGEELEDRTSGRSAS